MRPQVSVRVLLRAADEFAPLHLTWPQGFFDNRQDDAKARGVKLPDAKDKEDQFKAFQRKIEEELRDQAAVEEDEAVEAAGDREDREAHEQR